MKPLLILISLILAALAAPLPILAQENSQENYCQPILDKAQQAYENKNLNQALKLLQDAETCDYQNLLQKPRQALQSKIFQAIQDQRKQALQAEKEANQQRNRAQAALKQVEKAQEETQTALAEAQALNQKNERLISSLYFYDGKYALAVKREGGKPKYGFIDKNGNTRIEYTYDEARPFDNDGFAWVKKADKTYLIDTTGTAYRLAENLGQLTVETEALDLRKQKLGTIPDSVFDYIQLKVLLLSGNQLIAPPPGWGN